MLIFIIILILWFLSGLAGGLYWPLKYYNVMLEDDWWRVAKWLPFNILIGPFSFIANMPV